MARIEPTTSRVFLSRRVLYRCAATTAYFLGTRKYLDTPHKTKVQVSLGDVLLQILEPPDLHVGHHEVGQGGQDDHLCPVLIEEGNCGNQAFIFAIGSL